MSFDYTVRTEKLNPKPSNLERRDPVKFLYHLWVGFKAYIRCLYFGVIACGIIFLLLMLHGVEPRQALSISEIIAVVLTIFFAWALLKYENRVQAPLKELRKELKKQRKQKRKLMCLCEEKEMVRYSPRRGVTVLWQCTNPRCRAVYHSPTEKPVPKDDGS